MSIAQEEGINEINMYGDSKTSSGVDDEREEPKEFGIL
jgi:hypothetical protein